MRRERVGVIGGGSAAEQFVRSTAEHLDITVFEPGLVGGECPFLACMPSKAMLHSAQADVSWEDALRHRREVTHGLDDSEHVAELQDLGARLVRSSATLVGPAAICADGHRHDVDHIVLATGAEPVIPQLDGPQACLDAIWTSDDVYTSSVLPRNAAIIGGGVIGLELAEVFSRFGSDVTVIEQADRPLAMMPERVSGVVVDALAGAGVRFVNDAQATTMEPAHDSDLPVRLGTSDGSSIDADRVIAAVGRRPNLDGLGVSSLGLDPAEPLPIESNGRVRCDGSVWAVGDVVGRGQYTHVANHHAEVVADYLVGTATRSFDEVTVSSCVFTSPPLVQTGDDWADLAGDPDVVSVEQSLASFPRATTDELGAGHLWVAARRSTGTVVAAAGAGPSFDELIHAIVVAIDGRVPVARLRRSMQPFPTIGEILRPIWSGLHDQLTDGRPEQA